MKKFALLLAGLLILGGVAAYAQDGHLVVRAGYNYANLTLDKSVTVSDMIKGHSGWQIGAGYQTEASRGFSFQPEVVYKVTGYTISSTADLRLGYLEVPLNVQWGPDLVIARPFIFAGPYFGFKLSNTIKGDISETSAQDVINGLKKAEWGLGVGLGINFWKIQVAGKYNWNFGEITQTDFTKVPTLEGKPRTFEISVGLLF